MSIRSYLSIVAFGAVTAALTLAWLLRFASAFDATETPSQLAETQHQNPGSVVFLPDLRFNAQFKNRRMEIERPDIVWFGTSRAGSAMASMFKPYSFYNMAFTGWTMEQLTEEFEQSTRVARPKIAIISLDYFLFTDRWESQLQFSREMIFGQPWRFIRSNVSDFLRAVINHFPEFRSYAAHPGDFVGFQADRMREGFRFDGSWLFSAAHLESSDRKYKNLKFSVQSFPGGPDVSARQKDYVARIAEVAKARGIRLVAVQLPYLRVGVDYLDRSSPSDAFYGVWHEFESQATPDWLAGLGIEFLNLSHSPIDDDPANFIDAYHLSEGGMAMAVSELWPALRLNDLNDRNTNHHEQRDSIRAVAP
jgi:hypothetical protein